MKLYGELCELEIVQSKKNPENKSVYQSLSLSIREACTRFTNREKPVVSMQNAFEEAYCESQGQGKGRSPQE